jgi:HlyD family secretion protein
MTGKRIATVVKTVLILVGVLFLTKLGLHLLNPERASAMKAPFQLAQVQRGTMESLVASTGTLAAVETVDVGTQVSGTIARLAVDYNDRVKKGQILAVLDQALFKATVGEAEATVAKARAQLSQAEDEFRRNKPLADKGYLSEQEFLPIRTGVDTARADLAAARAALKRAQTNLDYTVIRSPIDGIIIARSVDAGQTVAASFNTPTLFVIARDLSHMQIEATVDESDIGQIRQGQAARFTVQAFPDKTFLGKVTQIRLQPQTISNVVNYTVIVQAENNQGLLLPGMTATVDFVVARVENALLVPNAALRFEPREAKKLLPSGQTAAAEGDSGRLYTLGEKGGLRPVKVARGPTDGVSTVVTGSNIRQGMEVVTGLKPQDEQAAQKGRGFFSIFGPPRRGH